MLETDKEEINYSDKGFNKVIINFVGIETASLRSHISFSSKLKL